MLIAGAIAGECRLNRASQQWMIGQDPWGNGWGEWELWRLPEHPAHENRGEDSVWENRGGARTERERLREWEAQSLRERAPERMQIHWEKEWERVNENKYNSGGRSSEGDFKSDRESLTWENSEDTKEVRER